ncbi:uncharacterized protein LOC117420585 isoform X2 [Acipenser ruthenus]|uniref:uncharacterized protein LOC117420585 isoform X2 n=1 Tax=Acipenser ruthenus TaxID=7906 RepID=UPI0027405A69|nr:uncharacterized protein LOC117420585 isoform X2 [Acipenser ruthenus]
MAEVETSSISTTDTELLSDVSSPERLSRWPPGIFPMPTFAYEVELKLREGNTAFERNGKCLQLSRDQKHDILEKLAATIYSFKAYPNDRELSKAAEALVSKHPCLKELGSETGWYGWKNSIKYKMGNYRTKLRRAGCQDVIVNAGKISRSNPENEPSHSNLKRPKRAEVNFLPDFPKGQDLASLERQRLEIIHEVQKTEKTLPLIDRMMQTTFALRRQEVVTNSPPVRDILERWPALCLESQVYAEFQRITNQNLPNIFYEELDRHTLRLMTLYRQRASKTGKTSDALADILRIHDLQVEDSDEPDVGDAPVAILTAVSDNTEKPIHFNPIKISIVH